MAKSKIQFLLSAILLTTFCLQPIQAIKKSYIVYLGSHSHGLNPTSADIDSATTSHYNMLGSLLGSQSKAQESLIYSYNKNINGFAAMLEKEEADKLAKHPNVVSVFLSQRRELHTTHSWEFLGLESKLGVIDEDSAWTKGSYGQDTIIANLDTGVWPESESFSDEGMGPIPTNWKCPCLFGDDASNKTFCNRKLIGARYFIKGYEAYAGPQNKTLYSTRDEEGHGSHTLSTAGGNFVKNASVFGLGKGVAKGGSPKARVVAYKVCWPDGCFDEDLLAGFDAAISDGVHVISASVGGAPIDLFYDSIAIGSFHANARGIVVVASAGNSGPIPGTVANLTPWILTVGASTIDRNFVNHITLGDNKKITGSTITNIKLPAKKLYPLINSKDGGLPKAQSAELCLNGTLDPAKVKGKIVLCLRGENARVAKGLECAQAGAVGMILANDAENGDNTIADPHLLPATNINYEDGQYIYKYINKTKNPVAYMTSAETVIPVKPAPVMAAFSSRGPNLVLPSILKPDITAPGVDIIAAYTLATSPTGLDFDKRRVNFTVMSGTSMSCPHVSGVVGLIKTLHPDWTPAAIRSAIMTSASIMDDTDQKLIMDAANMKDANPFTYGAGHIEPDEALEPGLVYDLTNEDYLNFLCGNGYNGTLIEQIFTGKPYKCPKSYNVLDFNYPSIMIPSLGTKTVNLTRTVTHVSVCPTKYSVEIKAPPGLNIFVEPSHLKFKKAGEKKTFQVMIEGTGTHRPAAYSYGEINWTNGVKNVRSPVVVHHK